MKHLTSGFKQLNVGLIGEILNYCVIGTMPDESITYAQENMLPHSYTLMGLGKILHSKNLMNKARHLRREARDYCNKRNKLYLESKVI